jgi:hypothetical protein
MLEELLVNNIWLVILLWIVLYISDYQLTIVSARRYQTVGEKYLSVEGSFELTPFYERDVDALRRFSPRLLAVLALQCLLILFAWTLSKEWGGEPVFFWILGAFFLLEVVIHIRHLRNLVTYHYFGQGEALWGKLDRSRWLVLRLSAVDLIGYAAIFLLVFLLTGSWFFVGGVTSCLVTAAKHWHQANKARSAQPKPSESSMAVDEQSEPQA